MAQYAAPVIELGPELYAPKVRAIDVRDAIMARETLVHECVVGRQELEDAAVLAHDGLE